MVKPKSRDLANHPESPRGYGQLMLKQKKKETMDVRCSPTIWITRRLQRFKKVNMLFFDLHTMRAKSTRGPKWKEAELNTNCKSNCCRVINGPSNSHTYSSLRAMSRGVYSLLFRTVEIQLKTSLLNH